MPEYQNIYIFNSRYSGHKIWAQHAALAKVFYISARSHGHCACLLVKIAYTRHNKHNISSKYASLMTKKYIVYIIHMV